SHPPSTHRIGGGYSVSKHRTHPLFLEQETRKLALPDPSDSPELAEIKCLLRDEQQLKRVLALRKAETQDNPALHEELDRQEQECEKRIEGLEYGRSERAFLDALKEGQHTGPPRRLSKRSSTKKSLPQKQDDLSRYFDGVKLTEIQREY